MIGTARNLPDALADKVSNIDDLNVREALEEVAGGIEDERSHQVLLAVAAYLRANNEPLGDQDVRRILYAVDDAFPKKTGTPEADLGPFYSTRGLARRLNVSRQALHARAKRHTLLGLPSSDGQTLFPAFQFVNPNQPTQVVPGLAKVFAILAAAGAGPMLTAAWVTAPQPLLRGKCAVDWLRDHQPLEDVLTAALNDAERWQH